MTQVKEKEHLSELLACSAPDCKKRRAIRKKTLLEKNEAAEAKVKKIYKPPKKR